MIKSHYIVLTILIFFLNNIIIWYQLNGQLVWGFWKTTKGIIIMLSMGIPISGLFYLGTKIGYEGFGSLWSVRLLGFAVGMMTFPFITYMVLGEGITLKTGISVLLAGVILLLQLL